MKKIVFTAFFIVFFMSAGQLHADDTELFTIAVPSDVLIILDMSGSMNYSPAGPPYVSSPNRRIDIARKVLFDLLDDNEDGKVDAKDEPGLNMRLGYMRYRNSINNDDSDPLTGSIKVLSSIGTPYKDIWSAIDDNNEINPVGGTPLAASLAEAKTHFLRDVNPVDPSILCRKKFVLLITDGADTFGCSGNGADPNCGASEETTNPGMYRRRMQTVQRAKELADAGIKVFVVGFGGSAPECLKRTLDWAAFYGGADNPVDLNVGDNKAYNITSYGDSCTTTDTNADPALYPLSGYAFLAEDATALSKAIKTIAKYIQERSYSFTAPTIPLVRILDKDVGYISSFIPDETPFWRGNLKAYRLNSDGTFPVDADGNPLNANLVWDAVVKLENTLSSDRRIYTYINDALTEMTYGNLTNPDLGFPNDPLYNPDRQKLIDHIRGIDAYDVDQDLNTTEERNWKLGDVFHSNAVILGSPNRYHVEEGFSGSGEFYDTRKDRTKIILVGANDGMLHAFNAATGAEEWAFIPPSLLKNLKSISTEHTYYVDSSPKISDVWLYSTPTDTTKSAGEWRTILICGLRKGGKQYFALDVTDTLNPVFLWEFPRSNDAVTLAKVGQSWSEPAIGKVKVEHGGELYERWVAFIGGGYDPNENKSVKAAIGRSFFVIDIKTGEMIWEYSSDPLVNYPVDDPRRYMTYSLPAPPTAVDLNSNGFVDKVYIGDLGGQMWAFDVSFDAVNKKSNTLWSAKRLTAPPASNAEKHPVFYQAAVAFDENRKPWVYYGTGDRENPTDTTNPAEFFYAVKDDGDGIYPRRENHELLEVSSVNTFIPDPSKKGWYLVLEHSAQLVEKVLAKPVVFNNIVYFTTYAYRGKATGCSVEGDARLYELYYTTGGGALEVDELIDLKGTPSAQRYQKIGYGVPSNPVISVNTAGKASIVIGTTSGQVFSKEAFSGGIGKAILYWREVIR